MIGISTVWRSEKADAYNLLEALEQFDIDGVELEYRISPFVFGELRPLIKKRGINITSLHNTCPVPVKVASLSSKCEEERKIAVEQAFVTIRNAHELEAKAVVVHLGDVEVENPKKFVVQFKKGKITLEEAEKCVKLQLLERNTKKQKYFDNALFSLDDILKEAEKRNVTLGIENRYYIYQIPNFEELGFLLKEFAGAPLGYWHDMGHAHVMEFFGITPHYDWLEAYDPVGIHLHDAQGVEDHLAPGNGEIDWKKCISMFPKDAIKTLEIRSRESSEDIRRGIRLLKGLGLS